MNIVYLYIYSDVLECLLTEMLVSQKSFCTLSLGKYNYILKFCWYNVNDKHFTYLILVRRILLVVLRKSFIQNYGSI